MFTRNSAAFNKFMKKIRDWTKEEEHRRKEKEAKDRRRKQRGRREPRQKQKGARGKE